MDRIGAVEITGRVVREGLNGSEVCARALVL